MHEGAIVTEPEELSFMNTFPGRISCQTLKVCALHALSALPHAKFCCCLFPKKTLVEIETKKVVRSILKFLTDVILVISGIQYV